jgi:hypothetical protein
MTATLVVASFGIAVLLYLTPTLVAQRRGHPQIPAILAVNLALGWTFVGWALALAWSIVAGTSVPTPRRNPLLSRTVTHVFSGADDLPDC